MSDVENNTPEAPAKGKAKTYTYRTKMQVEHPLGTILPEGSIIVSEEKDLPAHAYEKV